MPISKYFGGHGEQVMEHMMEKHGPKKGKRIFYATANKKKKGVKDHMMQMKSEGRLKGK